MVGTNLGLGEPMSVGAAPVWAGYLHVLVFFGPFVPLLAWRWREIDPPLRRLCLTLATLVLVSTLAFGWLYESRNYLPIVPLLMTAVLPVRPGLTGPAPASKP
jgi:hypothetical protein